MTEHEQAQAVIEGFLGPLTFGDKVEHLYTGKRGRLISWASDRVARVRWFGGRRVTKNIAVSLLKRV